MATTAALAVLDTIEKENLRANAVTVGKIIQEGLARALSGVPGFVGIRGMGLMIGVELDRPCGELVSLGLEAGLLINVTSERVVRLLPALNFTADEGRELAERLAALIRAFLSS